MKTIRAPMPYLVTGTTGTTRTSGAIRPACLFRNARAMFALCSIVLVLHATSLLAQDGGATVYLSKQEALAYVFPAATRVVELRHLLSREESDAIAKLTRQPLEEGGFFLYAAFGQAEPTGYAVIVAEIGKVRPITHIVSVQPDGSAGSVAVMIYRESHGAEVASARFMAQYSDKSLADPLRIDRDIINIAGSTLSGHAICRGVRKALAVAKVVLLDRMPEERAALLATGTDVTPPHGDSPPAADVSNGAGTDAGAGANPGAGAGRGTVGAASGEVGGSRSLVTDAARTEVLGPGHLRAERAVMGSVCSIEAFETDAPGNTTAAAGTDAGAVVSASQGSGTTGAAREADAALADALRAALAEVARWDAVLSDWKADTPLSQLNATPVGVTVTADGDLLEWLADSAHWHAVTDGAFDPTVGALVAAWGLRTTAPARPAPDALAAALRESGWPQLALDTVTGTVARDTSGLFLDPGGSGKGWALDRAADVLRSRGVSCALLSFGSTLLALDAPPGTGGWRVPVVHGDDDRAVTEILLHNGALSVSGGGYSTFDDGGVLRGHVIDPQTGVPVQAGRLAWVRHGSAGASDALSTALLVRGASLPAVPDASGVFIAHVGDAPVDWPARP